MTMHVTPNGSIHEVPLDDLFFSTTDAKGVIDEANEVFTRNARYPRETLIGAPHNIIRHPDMPGAVFRVLWDGIEGGDPIAAYVLNLAGDGSAYWAFATIVRIGDRYLSVRSSPRNYEARDLLHGLYGQVRAAEVAARENEHLSAAAAAERGRDVLAAALADNGYASYGDFQLDLVPEEVAAREAAGPVLPDLAEGPENLRTMVVLAGNARTRLGDFAEQLTRSLHDADALARDLRRLRQPLTAIQSSHADLALIGARAGDALTMSASISDELVSVRGIRKHLRLSTAIARLQAEAVARYVVAVAEGREDPRVSERALASLTEALLAILDADLQADAAATEAFTTRISDLTSLLGEMASLTRMVAQSVSEVSERRELEVAAESLSDLLKRVRAGAETLGATTAGLDRDRLADELAKVVDLSSEV
ncbi:MAG: hypothetical protein ACK5MP_11920 [Nostocoides sp.]